MRRATSPAWGPDARGTRPDASTLEHRRRFGAVAISERFAQQLGRDRIVDLSLVVSELVTNAVLHGRGSIMLNIRVDGDGVSGEVVDEGGGFAWGVRERGRDDLNGRGLMIVDALSRRWGINEGTTHVWFELAEPSRDPSVAWTQSWRGPNVRPGFDETP